MTRLATALATVLLFGATPASADIITVNFAGIANGSVTQNLITNERFYFSETYTALFTFDTAKGTTQTPSPGSYLLTGGLTFASITIANVGSRGGAGDWLLFGQSYLAWQDDLSHVSANAGGGNFHLNVRPGGYFQFSICPALFQAPCGTIQTASVTSFTQTPSASVPGPVVGAGLPGLLLACAALIALARRRRNRDENPNT